MTSGRRFLAAVCLGALSACATAPPGPPGIRVLVFNIHAGKDAAGAPNLDGVAELVRSTSADVVLLQEVDRGTKRSGNVDQLQRLADLVNAEGQGDYAPAFGKSLDYDGGEYGIAALVRGTVTNSRTEPLPVEPPQERSGKSYEPRAALIVEADTRLGTLQLVNTHLDASRPEHYRLQESAHILTIVNRMEAGRGLMAGGDFNAEPGSRTYQQLLFGGLQDAWLRCGEGDGYTFPADKPIKRIDYLFLAPGLRCTSAQVLDTRVSDHRPLLVTVTR